ncbi:MAG: hypothetical protein IPJ41_04825 [Phycisphaerales bacterium]|nr:hypothetical protein [Phycisphaerales bacterium]
MAYPESYQHAEHLRALDALLADIGGRAPGVGGTEQPAETRPARAEPVVLARSSARRRVCSHDPG